MIADTSFIIDLMRKKPDALKKLSEIEKNKESQSTTSLTVFELAVGIAMTQFPDEEKKKIEEQLLKFSIYDFSVPYAYRGGLELGKLLKKGNPIDPVDVQIAGIALSENEKVVTRNIKHFNKIDDIKVESY